MIRVCADTGSKVDVGGLLVQVVNTATSERVDITSPIDATVKYVVNDDALSSYSAGFLVARIERRNASGELKQQLYQGSATRIQHFVRRISQERMVREISREGQGATGRDRKRQGETRRYKGEIERQRQTDRDRDRDRENERDHKLTSQL